MVRVARCTLAITATALVFANCKDSSLVSPKASVLSLASGGGQSANAGATLAPIVVKVSDAAGDGIAGEAVTFTVTTGGGSVTPGSGTSNAEGLVTTSWTLGATEGAQTMTASGSFALTLLTIGATATPTPSLRLSSSGLTDTPPNSWIPALGIGQ